MTTITMTEFLGEVNKFTQLVSSGEELALRLQNGKIIRMLLDREKDEAIALEDILTEEQISGFKEGMKQANNREGLIPHDQVMTDVRKQVYGE